MSFMGTCHCETAEHSEKHGIGRCNCETVDHSKEQGMGR